MRLYRVSNTAKTGRWICAPNENVAKDVAMRVGTARKRENLTIRDQTEFYLNHQHGKTLAPILKGKNVGTMTIKLIRTNPAEPLPEYRGEWQLNKIAL